MASSFISFPILTRVFSVSDYGVLGIIGTTLLIATSIAKLGFPESILRFYAEFKYVDKVKTFYSTLFFSSLAMATTIALLLLVSTQLMRGKLEGKILNLAPLVSVLIITGGITAIMLTYLRAEQRTRFYNVIMIIQRYVSLGLGIFLIHYFIKGLYGFYVGLIISGLAILSYLIYVFHGRIRLNPSSFSWDIFSKSIKFGFPLALNELGALLLNYIDRYFIQFYVGSIGLGLYTAGYNLATYATDAVIYPIGYAMTPIYMNILINRGEDETKTFLGNTLKFFLLISIPLAFGFIAIGRDLLIFLASSKYVEANIFLPYVIIGQFFHASTLILNCGLLIRKKSHVIALITLATMILNIGLNVIMIPNFGILGAAQATLISYFVYAILITYYSFKDFSFKIDFRSIMLYVVISIGMYFVIGLADYRSNLLNLFIKILIGVVFYFGLIIILDKEVKNGVYGILRGRFMKTGHEPEK